MRRLRVLTWHVHGNYLLYLTRANADFYVPVSLVRTHGYGGRGTTFPFRGNVYDVPVEAVRSLDVDCILFQSRTHYEEDQYEILSAAQRKLPRIYLEHDPPLEHPTELRHFVDDPEVLVVHVTPFNHLMWSCDHVKTRVIDHGVFIPEGVEYSGELARGVVVVNHMRTRGRRVGGDVFERARQEVPLDLVGMDSESLGGLGEVFPPNLPAFEARYRLFFNPIRYTSLNLAVIEAMMIGLPIVGLATTEMVTVVETGVSGYLDTDVAKVIDAARRLVADPAESRRMGAAARRYALERFSIDRFTRDWEETFALVTGRPVDGRALIAPGIALERGDGQ